MGSTLTFHNGIYRIQPHIHVNVVTLQFEAFQEKSRSISTTLMRVVISLYKLLKEARGNEGSNKSINQGVKRSRH